LLALLGWGGTIRGQEPSASPASPPQEPTTAANTTQANTAGECFRPAPGGRWQDYQGPTAKAVYIFGRGLGGNLERQPGIPLCSFSVKHNFNLFVEQTAAPATFAKASFFAAVSQAENNDARFGQEAGGYGKRFGAALADQASFRFFKTFVYPSIFSEDPRYYRLGRGTAGERLLHAIVHSVLGYHADGTRMFNFSEWLGPASAAVLGNTYHPGNRRGFGPVAGAVAANIGNDIGADTVREFWPEIARRFRLRPRGSDEPLH
jgi:hypothetical protein